MEELFSESIEQWLDTSEFTAPNDDLDSLLAAASDLYESHPAHWPNESLPPCYAAACAQTNS